MPLHVGDQHLPDGVLQQVLQLLEASDLGSLRLASKQLLESADCLLKRKRVERSDASAVAAAAQRSPHLQELDITPLEQGKRKQRNAGVLALLRAAGAHWPQLTKLVLAPKDDLHVIESFQCAAQHLGTRLTSLSLDWDEKLSANMQTASVLVAQFPQLSSLSWTCGAVTDAVVEQLGQLATLRRLQLGKAEVPQFDYNDSDTCSYYSPFMYWGRAGETWTGQSLAALTQLTSLHLVGSAQIHHGLPTAIHALRALTLLKDLVIHTRYASHAAKLRAAVAPMQHLRTLSLGQDRSYYSEEGSGTWAYMKTWDVDYTDDLQHLANHKAWSTCVCQPFAWMMMVCRCWPHVATFAI